jgi:hypothetical protein
VGNTGGRSLVKGSPACDPNAQPIVFAIEIDQTKYAVLPSQRPDEFSLQRGIPPEHLRQVYRPVDELTWTGHDCDRTV